jgi:hypothetical protein
LSKYQNPIRSSKDNSNSSNTYRFVSNKFAQKLRPTGAAAKPPLSAQLNQNPEKAPSLKY